MSVRKKMSKRSARGNSVSKALILQVVSDGHRDVFDGFTGDAYVGLVANLVKLSDRERQAVTIAARRVRQYQSGRSISKNANSGSWTSQGLPKEDAIELGNFLMGDRNYASLIRDLTSKGRITGDFQKWASNPGKYDLKNTDDGGSSIIRVLTSWRKEVLKQGSQDDRDYVLTTRRGKKTVKRSFVDSLLKMTDRFTEEELREDLRGALEQYFGGGRPRTQPRERFDQLQTNAPQIEEID